MDEGFTTIDGSSSDGLGSLQPSIIPSNVPLLSAFLAFSLAQFLKLFTTWYKEKRWDPRRLVRSGGMPSSHSATVSALAVAIGFQEGSGGSAFAVAVVLAFIVNSENIRALSFLSFSLVQIIYAKDNLFCWLDKAPG
ncbi:uncharacterized protein LOC116145296 isoform X3 [Pistacia vera]|uniref:uncharacterized protein LOC116145296 isoform X3 n=1 Tax=Pistacia vera TaxID=55513 RepID=UPI001262C0BE|nr:uncharacterized protein LOC116145296 isoform X3 [Pistacia vera]